MDDLCCQECQDGKSKNYLYKDSQRSSSLRPQFMHVHRAMRQIIRGMFWFNSHSLEYRWCQPLMELYWPLGNCRSVHCLINCLGCGWPGSLTQVTTGKGKSRAKLLIPWRMRFLSNPKLIRTQDSWGHLTSGPCQMNHSFKQFGETRFSNFSPKFSSWSCPSGPCEKGVSLGHSRLVDRNKHKRKTVTPQPVLFREWLEHPLCQRLFLQILPLPFPPCSHIHPQLPVSYFPLQFNAVCWASTMHWALWDARKSQ